MTQNRNHKSERRKKYELEYSKIALKDLEDIMTYISINLQNPIAAENFAKEYDRKVNERRYNPLAFSKYQDNKKRKNIYYTLLVKNYTVFYIVKSDTMKIHRVIYSRRNFQKLI